MRILYKYPCSVFYRAMISIIPYLIIKLKYKPTQYNPIVPHENLNLGHVGWNGKDAVHRIAQIYTCILLHEYLQSV